MIEPMQWFTMGCACVSVAAAFYARSMRQRADALLKKAIENREAAQQLYDRYEACTTRDPEAKAYVVAELGRQGLVVVNYGTHLQVKKATEICDGEEVWSTDHRPRHVQ